MTRPAPAELIRAGRPIVGCSAVLLPFGPDGSIDWTGFESHLDRTIASGLQPAVNMDTGHVHLLRDADKRRVLDAAAGMTTDGFIAGAHVGDEPGAALDPVALAREVEAIASRGGTPVVFPSFGLAALTEDEWVAAHARVADACDRFIGFELGAMFNPAGRIVTLDAYRALMEIEACIGAKHSSLHREPEWERLQLRDAVRPDFRVFTGNDLAIDMVIYGSDYLLGLSSFAPDFFAQRDRWWADGDNRFFELNDALQHLGNLAFRAPVPGYRHSAAQFLHLRGWIEHDRAAPGEPTRPASDVPLLEDALRRIAAAAELG